MMIMVISLLAYTHTVIGSDFTTHCLRTLPVIQRRWSLTDRACVSIRPEVQAMQVVPHLVAPQQGHAHRG
jgi:hypothetical protein